MEDSPATGLELLADSLRAVLSAEFDATAAALLRGDEPEAYRAVGIINLYRRGALGDDLRRWLEIHVGHDAALPLFARLSQVDAALTDCRRVLDDARDIGAAWRISGKVPERLQPSSNRITKSSTPPMTDEQRIQVAIGARVQGALQQWDTGRSRARDAREYVAELLQRVTDEHYTAARSPDEWEKCYGLSWRTLKRRIDQKQLRAIEVHSKSWRIHRDDLPAATNL